MTALDSNVLITLWDSDRLASESAAQGCLRARQNGPLAICGPVFCELLGLPRRNEIELRGVLDALEILIDWNFTEKDWQIAGNAYQGCVKRRRASGGGLPRRMATDFLIGAHATARNDRLMTLDRGRYRSAFPGLRIESF